MNKSKTRGRFIMFAGLLLVLSSLCLTIYNSYSENKAAKESDKVLSRIVAEKSDTTGAPDYLLSPDIEMPRKEFDGKYYVGTLSIPALSMSWPVVDEWSYANFKIAPCVYEGTPYKHNLIICAHNYRKHFGPINNLVPGDEVSFTDMDGNVFKYEVMYTDILDDEAAEELSSGEWDLTLFTCTYSGSTRITVRCKSVGLY